MTVQPQAAQIPTFCNERGATLPKCRLASRTDLQINSRFWLYITRDKHWRVTKNEELGLFESGEQVCDRMWRTHLAYTDDEYRPFAAHLSQVTPANRQQISGHISPFFPANKEDIMKTYNAGRAVAGTGGPIFLSWQPEPVRD